MQLKEQLKSIIPEGELNHLLTRFQIIGDIVIVSVPPEMKIDEKDIAKAIFSDMGT